MLQQLAKLDVTAAGSEAWTHVYDAAGERVWSCRTSSSRVDTFALRGPGGKVLSLFTKTPGSPAPTYSWKDYVYREGQLLGAKLSDGTIRHFDVDHLGSVRLETDAAGTIAYRELWPYGEEATPLSGSERMKFTGHERDFGALASNADDLDYMHARYYRPLVGRFLSLDPSRQSANPSQPKSWNRYSYALSNPLLFVDPDGRQPYLVARNGPFYSSHMFVVTHARYVGDPAAQVYSWGRSTAPGREGKLGRVDNKTKRLSEGTAETDRRTWLALGKKGSPESQGVHVQLIQATDGKAASVANSVQENKDYHAVVGPNSNSAAQAVADRAQGPAVSTPERYDPAQASGNSKEIGFDEDQIERDRKSGKHNENVTPMNPPPP